LALGWLGVAGKCLQEAARLTPFLGDLRLPEVRALQVCTQASEIRVACRVD